MSCTQVHYELACIIKNEHYLNVTLNVTWAFLVCQPAERKHVRVVFLFLFYSEKPSELDVNLNANCICDPPQENQR